MKRVSFFLLFLSLWLFSPSSCWAQSFSLSIDPPILEAMIQPGKKIIYTFDVVNLTDQPLELVADIIPFTNLDNQGGVKLLTQEEAPDFFSLLNADMALGKEFYLAGQDSIQLVLLISVPDNYPEGDYYQTLLLQQSLSQDNSLGNLSSSLGGIGTNILLTVSTSGKPAQSLEVTDLSLKNSFWGQVMDSFSQTGFNLTIKNTGQAFVKPEGNIYIRREKDGENLTQIPIRPDNILPQTSRDMVCLTEDECLFDPPDLIGSYQAVYEFSLGGETYQSATTFWVFPLWLILALVFLLVAIILAIYFLKRGQLAKTDA